MDKDLFSSILNDIKCRKTWSDRQAVWYQMRRDGIRRKTKPFPGAADMHFPLVDTVIEKFKPFYTNQLFATDRLADFISKDPQLGEAMTDVAWWFDYKVKHHSNLEREIMYVFDIMLQAGRGICKVSWDADNKRLRFDSVEPSYLIVPTDTDQLQDADRIVHVQHFSPWKYKNGAGYQNRNQDPAFVDSITGRKYDTSNESNQLEQYKRLKEGITYSSEVDIIIVWEVYEKTRDGWKMTTVSPYRQDVNIRDTITIPYKHGLAPFVDFVMEETDKSYYSPRGVAEILAPFESSLCKMWNEKHDAMSFYNRPLFYATRDIPNAGNIRMRPGDILPFEIKPVDRGAPPISWDQEMINTRMVAEQRIAVPDFGMGQQINTDQRRTATEVEGIQSAMNTIIDMRSRMCRRQLGDLYKQAFALLCQYDNDFQFINSGTIKNLDRAALDAVLSIEPNGSSDSWNQHARLKKAIARKQLLGTSPFIDQGELDKSILELDEPGLVKRLFKDPGLKAQEQVARIMLVIPALEDGMAVPLAQDDDDATQASFLLEYIAREEQSGKHLDAQAAQAFNGRLSAHITRLQQANPKAAKAIQLKAIQIMKALAAPAGANGSGFPGARGDESGAAGPSPFPGSNPQEAAA